MTAKWLAAIFVIALTLTCKAGSGCDGCDTNQNKPTQKVAIKRVKKESPGATAKTQVASVGPGFCRNMYCKYSAGSPWWPGAPGD